MTNSLTRARATDLRAYLLAFAMLVCAAGASLYGTFAHAAAPTATVQQVYAAAASGDLKGAQAMMDQVLAAHPNSAKAHFVEAELSAKQGRLDKARNELATAERLEPGLPFAKPEAVQKLRARLSGRSSGNAVAAPVLAAAATAPAHAHGGPSWGLILMLVALIGAVVFFMRARNRAQYAAPQYMPAGNGNYTNGNYSGGYGQPPYGPQPYGPAPSGGMGSRIMGGLATGAAVGAGMVAGEALMNRMMGGGSGATNNSLLPPDAAASNYDMGGNDFGLDDTSSWDDGSGGGGDDGSGGW